MMKPMSWNEYSRSRHRLATRRGPAWLRLAAAACLMLAAAIGRAEDVKDGSLLVANEDLKDPNFSHTVVLVIHHDDQGTVGVVLNRVTTLDPTAVFPEIKDGLGKYAGKLFRGGPVAPSRLLFLVRGLAAAVVQGPELLDHVFLAVDPKALPDIVALAEGPDNLRLYAGHAEWSAGQLEQEIAAGAWSVTMGDEDLVFATDPRRMWQEAFDRRNAVVADARAP
jgi:putative transcriptional regulator